MQLLDHVSISVGSLAEARPFYDEVMRVLGTEKVYDTATSLGYGMRCFTGEESHTCLAVYESLSADSDDKRHWCFKAKSRVMVDDFYRVGIKYGGKDNGPPGLRPHYHPNYYGAFLFDPSGNRIEAVYHGK